MNILDIEQHLSAIGFEYQFDETKTRLITGITAGGHTIPIVIEIVADYWLHMSTYTLSQKPLVDDAALSSFYKALLYENNYCKIGKFYLNEESFLEFAIDLRLTTIDENILSDAMGLFNYVINERFPQIAGPYVSYIF